MKVAQRLGKGNNVEELIVFISQEVRVVVNHHAVKSARPEQNAKLKEIVEEMKLVQSSTAEGEGLGMTINSGGRAQRNNVKCDSGQPVNNNASVGTQRVKTPALWKLPRTVS